MPYNAEVFAEGMGALGAGLSGVGGIEGQRQRMLQEMRDQAAMERLLKEAELKQQAEDNARAYAEAQQREFERALISELGNELPTGGSSNAAIVQAALNPAPGPMRGGLDPVRAAALFSRLGPNAGVAVYNSSQDRSYEYGVTDSPKYRQFAKESDSRVGENEASARSHDASAYASNMLGKRRVEETRRATTAADMERDRIQSVIDATRSLQGQRDSAAGLSAAKTRTEDETRKPKVDKILAQIDTEESKQSVDEARIDKIQNDIENDNTLLPAERQVLIEKADALRFKGLLDRARAENDTTRAKAYSDQKAAQSATEAKRQAKLDAETGVIGVLGRAKEAAINATTRLTGAKADKAEVDAAWQQTEEEQNYEKRLAQIDQTRQQYELAKNRTLTEAERLSAAKESKRLVDARIARLESQIGQSNAQTAFLKGKSAQIAYLLANPGIDQVRDLSRSLTRLATDPKASPKARAQATQQLSALLDQAFPGFSTEPGAEQPGLFGTSFGASKAPDQIRYTPQTAQTLQILQQLGAPEKLYSDEE